MGRGKQVATVGLMVVLLGIPAVTVLEVRLGQAQATDSRKEEADQFLKLCRETLQKQQYEAAVQACHEAAENLRQRGNRHGEGRAVTNIGVAYFQLSQYEKAIGYFQQALPITQSVQDRNGEAIALLNLGTAYRNLSQQDRAIPYYQQALPIAQAVQDCNVEANVLEGLGLAYDSLGNYGKAIDYQEQRLAIAQELKDRSGEGAALGNLGNAYLSLGNYGKAIDYQEESLAIAREIKDRRGEGAALGNLGLAYRALGNYGKAIDYHEQSLAIAREIKDRRGEGQSLGNLGNAYYALGNYGKVIDYQEQSLAIARELKNRLGEGTALGNLGGAYYSLGNYGKAIDYHEQSLAIAREIKDRLGEGQSLGNLGLAYRALGNYGKAIDYYEQSLAIAREIKDRQGEGQSLSRVGNAYFFLGNYGKAIEYQEQSLAIAREIKNRQGEGDALGNLGNAYQTLGNYGKAIEYQEQSLAITREIKDRQGEGDALGNLGNAYFFLGDYDKAIDYYEQRLAIAREIKDRLGEGNALGNLGNAYFFLGDYDKAIEYHEQQLAIAREIKDRQGEGIALNNLGLALFRSGNLPTAATTLREGIVTYELLRQTGVVNDADKVSIFEQQANTYRTLQQVLIAQNQPEAALEIAERGRARAFVELLAAKQATTNQSPTVKPLTIAASTPDPVGANGRSPLPNAPSTVKPLTITEIKQIAKDQKAILVQYSLIYDQKKGNSIYIWVVKPNGQVAFAQTSLKDLKGKDGYSGLTTLIDQSRAEDLNARGRGITFVENPDYVSQAVAQVAPQAPDHRHLKQLHELLIAPIAQHLPTDPNQRVIFLPQGELFFVPFPALKATDGQFLIDKHTITTAPAIQVLQLTRQQRQRLGNRGQGLGNRPLDCPPSSVTCNLSPKTFLIVGNPTMPSIGDPPQPLSSLEGAEKEAIAIAKLFGATPLIGAQATKSTVVKQMQQARLIHLATHGLLDDYKGLGVPGAIALAPDANPTDRLTPNGLLTAGEILDLKLQAELIVLSACDTGRGRITGDGVIGLSRSLISAGTPSVLVSLWKVPDDSTSFLMQEFYKNLQQPGTNKAQALRQAMLTTRAKFPEPKDWAAFTLMGEAE